MGNQNSSNDGDASRRSPFRPGGGALGLSKNELDKRCQPSGLYDTCQWEDKAIRKLMGDGKVAPRLKGNEFRSSDFSKTNTTSNSTAKTSSLNTTATAATTSKNNSKSGAGDQECPICFLYYPEVNVTKCCSANLCTECYLQVRPQKEKHSSCPFCNHHKLSISVAKKLSADQIYAREKEEQRVLEARIRARNAHTNTNTNSSSQDSSDDDDECNTPNNKNSGFGSSLEQDSRVALMRARSESIASSDENNSNNHSSQQPGDDTNLIQSLAMTAEERRRLEDEMRAQHAHPLALRIEAEAQERRRQNDRAYNQSHSTGENASMSASSALRELRAQRAAEQLFRHAGLGGGGGGGGSGGGSSRRSRGRGGGGPGTSATSSSSRDWNQIVDAFERGGNGEVQSLDDLVVLEAAILLSMEEENRQSHGDDEFDAARHARDGFPLVQTFLANRREDGTTDTSTSAATAATPEQVQSLARSLSSSRRRNQLLRSAGHRSGSSASRSQSRSAGSMPPDTALDTAAMLMRGISEEDQVAMAIAASLQDQSSSNTDHDNDASESNNAEEEAPPPPAEGSTSTQEEDMSPSVDSDSSSSGYSTDSDSDSEVELELEGGQQVAVGVIVDGVGNDRCSMGVNSRIARGSVAVGVVALEEESDEDDDDVGPEVAAAGAVQMGSDQDDDDDDDDDDDTTPSSGAAPSSELETNTEESAPEATVPQVADAIVDSIAIDMSEE